VLFFLRRLNTDVSFDQASPGLLCRVVPIRLITKQFDPQNCTRTSPEPAARILHGSARHFVLCSACSRQYATCADTHRSKKVSDFIEVFGRRVVASPTSPISRALHVDIVVGTFPQQHVSISGLACSLRHHAVMVPCCAREASAVRRAIKAFQLFAPVC